MQGAFYLGHGWLIMYSDAAWCSICSIPILFLWERLRRLWKKIFLTMDQNLTMQYFKRKIQSDSWSNINWSASWQRSQNISVSNAWKWITTAKADPRHNPPSPVWCCATAVPQLCFSCEEVYIKSSNLKISYPNPKVSFYPPEISRVWDPEKYWREKKMVEEGKKERRPSSTGTKKLTWIYNEVKGLSIPFTLLGSLQNKPPNLVSLAYSLTTKRPGFVQPWKEKVERGSHQCL